TLRERKQAKLRVEYRLVGAGLLCKGPDFRLSARNDLGYLTEPLRVSDEREAHDVAVFGLSGRDRASRKPQHLTMELTESRAIGAIHAVERTVRRSRLPTGLHLNVTMLDQKIDRPLELADGDRVEHPALDPLGIELEIRQRGHLADHDVVPVREVSEDLGLTRIVLPE